MIFINQFLKIAISTIPALMLLSACSSVVETAKQTQLNTVSNNGFLLTSHDISEQMPLSPEQVFNGFGCTGGNISPQLSWENAPLNTKSFAITVYDPDAPTGSGWWHWLAVNIPNSINEVKAGQAISTMANALETKNDYGSVGFGGACPPQGDNAHRYQVTVWALDVESLPVTTESSGALVGYFLNQHKLAKSTITATYQR